MRKSLPLIIAVLLLVVISVPSNAQVTYDLKRSVVGAGGSVFALNSGDGTKLSGEVGQTAIFTLTADGGNILHQGFWVFYGPPGDVEDENTISLSKNLNNYPNPFNSTTRIKYTLPGNGFVTIRVYDMVGRVMKTLVSEYQGQGEQEVLWNGKDEDGVDCAAGSYMYELIAQPSQTIGYGSFQEFTLRNVMVIVR